MGVTSLEFGLQQYQTGDDDGVGGNVFDGRKSDYYLADVKQTVQQFLTTPVNGSIPAAIVVGNTSVFLGPQFFGMTSLARDVIILHEAVHLLGKGDAEFGGSKQLSKLIIDNCFTAAEQQQLSAFMP